MEKVIKNKNLWVAEKLLEITIEKPYLVSNGNAITLELEDIFELSNAEIVESLKRLEDREVVSFDDEEDKYDIDSLKYIDLYFKKDKLVEFIETSKDRLYRLTAGYKKKELNHLLEVLALFLKFKSSKNPVDFSELDHKHIGMALWIADYSGALSIIYEGEPDVEWKGVKRPYILGISEVPKKFLVVNAPIIQRIEREIRQLVIMPQRKRIKLFLKNNDSEIDWKCANCNHFLKIKLKKEEQIANHLNDFYIHKFRICYKCRKRNLFHLTTEGKIKFSTTKKRLFGKKESLEEKAIKLNKALKMLQKNKKMSDKAIQKIMRR